jgi:cell fate regulator YaaT (PSP1 superfamily)
MFLKLNNKLNEGKTIIVSENKAKVNNAFVLINKKIDEKQLVIKNNDIKFEGKSEFIVDTNDPKLDIYVNVEHSEIPRNIELEEDEVELFIDLENKLSYVNKNEEKSILKQGVVEK